MRQGRGPVLDGAAGPQEGHHLEDGVLAQRELLGEPGVGPGAVALGEQPGQVGAGELARQDLGLGDAAQGGAVPVLDDRRAQSDDGQVGDLELLVVAGGGADDLGGHR